MRRKKAQARSPQAGAHADQPRIREGVMGSATRAGGDQGRAVAGEAGDAVDTRGLNGLGEGHRRQNGSEAPRQHRLARPRRTKQKEVMVRRSASPSALPLFPQQWRPSHCQLAEPYMVCHTPPMKTLAISHYKYHRFPAEIISHGVWL
jgi:hypothetical protein